MSTLENLFFEKGCKWPLSPEEQFTLNDLKAMVDNCREQEGKPLQIYLSRRPGFYASASSCVDGDAIIIGHEVGNLLYSTFLRAASHPIISRQIGRTGTDGKRDLKSMVANQGDDRRKQIFAVLAANTAIKYIVMHEYGHIRHGHADYLNVTNRQLHAYEETETPVQKGLPAITAQTLEYDADIVAATWLTEYCLCASVDRNTLPMLWSIPNVAFWGSFHDAMRVIFLIISVVSGLFPRIAENQPVEIGQSSHPHDLVRAYYMSSSVLTQLFVRSDIMRNINAFRFMSAIIIPMFRVGFEAHNLPVRELIGMHFANRDNVKYVLEAYMDEWERLHPTLNQLKRNCILAPPRPEVYDDLYERGRPRRGL